MSDSLKYSNLKTFGQIEAEGITITGQYSFPTLDGSLNQILTTDGAGTISFADPSSLLILTTSSIVNGTGISWTNVGVGQVRGDVSLTPFSTDDLSEGISNLYFTNERVDDQVSNLLQIGTTGVSLTNSITWYYNDVLGQLTPEVSLGPFDTDDLSEGATNLYYSDEKVDDRVANLVQSGIVGSSLTNSITWNYIDGLDQLIPEVSLGPFDTDALSEGATNLYFTDQRAEDAVVPLFTDTASVTWSYDAFAHTLEATANVGITGVEVLLDGGSIGTQPTLDFITGSNITLNLTNDAFNNKVLVEINANVSSFNIGDLGNVSIFSPGEQTNDILVFNGTYWTTYSLEEYGDVLGAGIESITYSELVNKVSLNQLSAGKKYQITDYQTVYSVPGTDTSPETELSGSVEPLIVSAISNNELSPIAFSPTYPQDIIEYSLEPTIGTRNTTSNSKGAILFREDTLTGNSYPADFREVIVRRWDNGSGVYVAISDNGNASLDYPIFGSNCVNNKFEKLNTTSLLAQGYTDDLPNIYLPNNSSDNYFGGECYGLTFILDITKSQFNGPSYNTYFIQKVYSLIHNSSILDTCVFNGVVRGFEAGPSQNGFISSTFGQLRDSKINTATNSTITGALTQVEINAISTSTIDSISQSNISSIGGSTITSGCVGVRGNNIVACNFTGTNISNSTFNSLYSTDFQGKIEDSQLGTMFSCAFRDNVVKCRFTYCTNSGFDNTVDNCTFNNVINCNFTGNMNESHFHGETSLSTFSVLRDVVFNHTISNCTLLSDIRISKFGRLTNTTTSVGTTQVSLNFLGQIINCNFNRDISNASLLNDLDSLTINVGSIELGDATISTEIVTDASGNIYERYLELVGSPALPEYTYALLS